MGNDEQREFWDGRAPDWIAGQEDFEAIGGWFGERALEHLSVAPGEHVVDIGCGTGETTVALARAAGASGRAVGVDISVAMVDEARRRAARFDDVDVTFVVADAQEGPVAEGADAVFSRFGVMFFADPRQAFSNLAASMRAGGRLAVVVWQEVFANEWMLLPGLAALTATGSMPAMPADGEPGPFSLADPDLLRGVLAAAGFSQPEIRPLQRELILERDSVDNFVRRSMTMGAAREAVRSSGDDATVAKDIADQLRRDLLTRIGDATSTRLTAAAWLATGTLD